MSQEKKREDHGDGPWRRTGVLVGAGESGGAFALMEYAIPPRTLVAPLHTHSREDEYSYVLRGTVGAQVGEQTHEARVGELLVKRRGIPHTLWNASETPARVLELIAPGGFEDCLAELHAPGGPPSADRLRALWLEYGIEMHASSTARLLSAHQLQRCATPS